MLKFELKNYTETVKFIEQFPPTMQKTMIAGALRLSMTPMLRLAKALVPSRSRKLEKSLRIVRMKKGISKTETSMAIKPVFEKFDSGKINGFYGIMVHEGTKDPRVSRNKDKKGRPKVMAFKDEDGDTVFTRSMKGIKPYPYLRRAYDSDADRTVKDFGYNLTRSINQFVDRKLVKKI